jgi:hypothetical protein
MSIGSLANRIAALIGLRIVRRHDYDELTNSLNTYAGLLDVAIAQRSQAIEERITTEVAIAELRDRSLGVINDLAESRRVITDYQHRQGHLEAENQELRDWERQATARQVRLSAVRQVRPTVVVIMTTVSQIPQLKALAGATLLRDTYDFVIVAYLEVRETGLLSYCVENGIALLNHNLELMCGNSAYKVYAESQAAKPYFGSAICSGAYPPADKGLLENTNGILAEVHWQNSVAWQAHRLLHQSQASLVILFEDNPEYHSGGWATVSRLVGIPVVIVPFTISGPREPAESHYYDQRYWAEEDPYGQFIESTLPQWVMSYRNRVLLRCKVHRILALEALGYAPPQPWALNSSKANVIAVESAAMREVYLRQGIPDSQIEVTGSISDDLLVAALKNADRIRQQLGLDAHRPTLLCSFPPNQLSAGRPDSEFHEFKTIVDLWLGELSKLRGWQIIIKPHPAMLRSDVEYLGTFGLLVTELETTSLIAVCDIFNTSVSSTIRWALACGKPVLNYDVYRYHYQDFLNEPAVITVCNFQEFSRELHRLVSDREVFDTYADIAKAASERWGKLDGRSGERIAALCTRLTSGL